MQRDTLIIVTICVLAVISGAWLFFSQTSLSAPAAVAFTVLETGTQSQITEQKNYRIKTAEEFEALWTMVYGEGTGASREIDFSRLDVLAVFDGSRPSGGYEVAVQSVTDTGAVREVVVKHREPDATCITTQALTSPFQFVIVPKSSLAIVRTDVTETVLCE
jgi:hypothetical protein